MRTTITLDEGWRSLGPPNGLPADDPRAFGEPLPPDDAWRQVEQWLDAPCAWLPQPTPQYRHVLGRLLIGHAIRGPLVSDVQLAALAVDHGVALVSTDADFARFAEVRWVDPLRSS